MPTTRKYSMWDMLAKQHLCSSKLRSSQNLDLTIHQRMCKMLPKSVKSIRRSLRIGNPRCLISKTGEYCRICLWCIRREAKRRRFTQEMGTVKVTSPISLEGSLILPELTRYNHTRIPYRPRELGTHSRITPLTTPLSQRIQVDHHPIQTTYL